MFQRQLELAPSLNDEELLEKREVTAAAILTSVSSQGKK